MTKDERLTLLGNLDGFRSDEGLLITKGELEFLLVELKRLEDREERTKIVLARCERKLDELIGFISNTGPL